MQCLLPAGQTVFYVQFAICLNSEWCVRHAFVGASSRKCLQRVFHAGLGVAARWLLSPRYTGDTATPQQGDGRRHEAGSVRLSASGSDFRCARRRRPSRQQRDGRMRGQRRAPAELLDLQPPRRQRWRRLDLVRRRRQQGLGSWMGSYLSSTSTYWAGVGKPSTGYQLHVSNTGGQRYLQLHLREQQIRLRLSLRRLPGLQIDGQLRPRGE